MFLWWTIYRCTKNPAIVDLAWTLLMGGLGLFYYLAAAPTTGASLAVLSLTLIWCLRLSLLIGYRLITFVHDGRYDALNASWKGNEAIRYLFFFAFQGIAALFLTLPVFFTMVYRTAPWSWTDHLGLFLAVVGFVGESLADYQLQRLIRSQPGTLCNVGLWRYSRHPNYFFEWVFWMGIFCLALPAPFGWITIISPLGLLGTLLFVTGIPPAEAQSLRSKPDAYKQYQRQTSPFIPWFYKR